MNDFSVNDAVVAHLQILHPCDKFYQQDRLLVGVIEDIDRQNGRAHIKTLESSYGSSFERYLLPLTCLKRFNLSFFEDAENAQQCGHYFELKAKKARLQSELHNVQKSLNEMAIKE